MAFLINSPGLVTKGTDASELFLVQSASVSASTVIAGAGNDTIQMIEGVATANAVSVVGEGGADLIQVSATVFDSKSYFKGGAGGDLVTFSAGAQKGTISLGAGSDEIRGRGAAFELNTVNFGAGSDNLSAAQALSAQDGNFSFGSGKDTVTLSANGVFNSSTFTMGGGADVVNISASGTNDNSLVIKGGAGGDTITLAVATDKLKLYGGNGNDLITQTAGEFGNSAEVLGGAGADTISVMDLSAAANSNTKIGGGAGKDVITISAAATLNGFDVSIMGGGGADSISIAAIEGVGTAGTVYGGGGADSITFSADVVTDTGIETKIGIASFSDSTLEATDLITFGATGTIATGATLEFVTDGIGTDLADAGSLTDTKITMASNIVTKFTATLSDLTARVAAIDALATTKGMVVGFMADGDNEAKTGSAAYLFIQGGATDTLVEINEAHALSGITTVTVANSSISFIMNSNPGS
jgi:hypothetical protein